jgi:hypothetical protein
MEDEERIQILVGKPEGNRPCKDIVVSERKVLKLILKKQDWGGVYWICLAQDRDK